MFAAALAALLASAPVAAVTDAEFSELREQLRELKEQYEKRIHALEQRLGEAERAAARAGSRPSARNRWLRFRPRRQRALGRVRSTPRSR
jgi:hypothetical protein